MARADGGAAGARVPFDGLSVEDLSFSHGAKRVLDRVGFEVPRGELCAIVGPSGAGKSTLLSMLAGFERPDCGRIRFEGADWSGLGPIERGVGMSFDDGALHEHLTVRANLDSAAAPRGEPADRRGTRVAAVADTLGIAPLLDRKPATLSAGERRRVAVGRAFIRAPQLALLDEPFANLDRANRFTVRQMVRELQRTSGATAIVVTHDPIDALAIADRLLVLIDGRVRACGPASEIAARPPDLEVAQLVDDLGMHAIELARDGSASEVLIAPAFAERMQELLAAAKVPGPVRIGARPAQIRVGGPRFPSIALDARVIAHEPAGVFTDLIATRTDGRALRARVEKDRAQELPIGSLGRFHVHEDELHLFAGPWPGVRID
jgi:ABC-type sugar transport system ATPase subunit